DVDNADGAGAENDATGFDVNFKQAFGPLELLLSYYTTEGLGTTALLFDGFDSAGNQRDSDGGLAQLTYTAGATKFGVNYGISMLDATATDDAVAPAACMAAGGPNSNCLVDENEKITVGVYHSLTPNLTLVTEYTDSTSTAHNGAEVTADNFNVGAFFAF
ncbi:unnamed protein product, partial [Chrysoparadoxa australica]